MQTGKLPKMGLNGGQNSSRIEEKPIEGDLPPADDEEDLDTYIKVFVENGLKLQDELMVNHEAIAAAKREYVAEFHRKRQIG